MTASISASPKVGYFFQDRDYWFHGAEQRFWWGRGAEALGLLGRKVESDDLNALFSGYAPSGHPLVKNAGSRDRRNAWDVTLSSDKSVSALYASGPAWVCREIEASQTEGVKAALGYIEEEIIEVRRGKAGAVRERAAGIVASGFLHIENRNGEPQLHTHLVLPNEGLRSDGTWGGLESRDLYRHQKVIGALYRAELAAQLERRLGVVCERRADNFRIKGVPQELCDHWSSRSREIRDELQTRGFASARAAEVAALSTRRAKDTSIPPRERFAAWKREAAEFGFHAEQVIQRQTARRRPEAEIDRAIGEALETLSRTTSHFGERDLVREVAVAAQGRGVPASRVRRSVKELIADQKEVLHLGGSQAERRFTTPAVIDVEARLIESFRMLHARKGRGVPVEKVETTIARYWTPRSVVSVALQELGHHALQLKSAALKRPTQALDRKKLWKEAKDCLSVEQASAVRFLTRDRGRDLRILEGFAGTGKTRTLRVAREIWEESGKKVVGVTLSGKAAKELRRGAGITSYTHAMLELMMEPGVGAQLRHHAVQLWREAGGKETRKLRKFTFDKDTVVVVDEASMLSSAQLARLTKAVERAGAKLVLVGDRQQLQAVEAGGAYAHAADRYGCKRLDTIVRQRDPRDVEAVKLVAAGQAAAALKDLADRGLVTVADNREHAVTKLVSDWGDNEVGRRQSALIVTATRAEAKHANTLCQAERLRRGEVEEHECVAAHGKVFHSGDRVLFGRNDYALGVRNGDLGTIVAVKDRPWPLGPKVAVRLDDGETVVVSLRRYDRLELGYCCTAHRSQGTTVENAYVLLGGAMQDRELSYVQLSRARGTTRLYTDEVEAGPQLSDLARQMSKSRQKTLAHEVLAGNAERLAAVAAHMRERRPSIDHRGRDAAVEERRSVEALRDALAASLAARNVCPAQQSLSAHL